MTTNASSKRSVEQRWRDLSLRRRWDLVAGGGLPEGTEEAVTALGYARKMLRRSHLWAIVALVAAFSIVIAIELLVAGTIDRGSLVLAGGIAVGVGLGFELGGRYQARRLHRKAEAALAESQATR